MPLTRKPWKSSKISSINCIFTTQVLWNLQLKFENAFHSVNYDNFKIGKLNVIVNTLKLYAEAIFFKEKKYTWNWGKMFQSKEYRKIINFVKTVD